jgi:hypothetical protein
MQLIEFVSYLLKVINRLTVRRSKPSRFAFGCHPAGRAFVTPFVLVGVNFCRCDASGELCPLLSSPDAG